MAKQQLTENKIQRKQQKPVKKKKRTSPGRYFKETVAELKKVNWPTRKALVNNTLAVIAFISIAALITGAVDFILAQGLNLVIK